jgi:hypothetical protein
MVDEPDFNPEDGVGGSGGRTVTTERLSRLDELTAISTSFTDMLLRQREDRTVTRGQRNAHPPGSSSWEAAQRRVEEAEARIAQLSRDHQSVLDARAEEVRRLHGEGVPSGDIRGHLDRTDKYRQGVPDNRRQGQWEGGERDLASRSAREGEAEAGA